MAKDGPAPEDILRAFNRAKDFLNRNGYEGPKFIKGDPMSLLASDPLSVQFTPTGSSLANLNDQLKGLLGFANYGFQVVQTTPFVKIEHPGKPSEEGDMIAAVLALMANLKSEVSVAVIATLVVKFEGKGVLGIPMDPTRLTRWPTPCTRPQERPARADTAQSGGRRRHHEQTLERVLRGLQSPNRPRQHPTDRRDGIAVRQRQRTLRPGEHGERKGDERGRSTLLLRSRHHVAPADMPPVRTTDTGHRDARGCVTNLHSEEQRSMSKPKPFTALTVKATLAVRPFRRKVLLPGLRAGRYTLRVIGSKGAWHLYVQRGNTLFRITKDAYVTQTQATLQGYAKYKVKATVYKGKAAA